MIVVTSHFGGPGGTAPGNVDLLGLLVRIDRSYRVSPSSENSNSSEVLHDNLVSEVTAEMAIVMWNWKFLSMK